MFTIYFRCSCKAASQNTSLMQVEVSNKSYLVPPVKQHVVGVDEPRRDQPHP